MKIRWILTISIISLFILSSFSIAPTTSLAEPISILSSSSSSIKIVLASDVHVEQPRRAHNFNQFINDTKILNPNYIFLLGDLVNYADTTAWNKFKICYQNLTETLRNNTRLVMGNHDSISPNATISRNVFYKEFGYAPNWTYQIGNILFIALAYEGNIMVSVGGYISDDQLVWMNNTIKSNIDKNIVILAHHPIRDTTYNTNTENTSFVTSVNTKLKALLHYHRYNITAWFHGHIHTVSNTNPSVMAKVNGITYFSVGTIDAQSSPYLVQSYWLNLTQGSKIANITPRISNAATNYFNNAYMRQITLKYPFDQTSDNLIDTTTEFANRNIVNYNNMRLINNDLWLDMNMQNSSDVWAFFKFNEMTGTSVKDWSGRGMHLTRMTQYTNWTTYQYCEWGHDAGGLNINGKTRIKADRNDHFKNVSRDFTIEITVRYIGTSTASGGLITLVDKTGEFMMLWDVANKRIGTRIYWSDGTNNDYYFSYSNYVYVTNGGYYHFTSAFNHSAKKIKSWANGYYLGETSTANKILGATTITALSVGSRTANVDYYFNGTLMALKISKKNITDPLIRGDITIKNPTTTVDRMIIAPIIFGTFGDRINYNVYYSTDNSTWIDANSRTSFPNSKTFWMKIAFSSDGLACVRLKAIGLRTAEVGILPNCMMVKSTNTTNMLGITGYSSLTILDLTINNDKTITVNATDKFNYSITMPANTYISFSFRNVLEGEYYIYVDSQFYTYIENKRGTLEFDYQGTGTHVFSILYEPLFPHKQQISIIEIGLGLLFVAIGLGFAMYLYRSGQEGSFDLQVIIMYIIAMIVMGVMLLFAFAYLSGIG